ncbi:MAG TPA: ShlB/FhaC/HecB family hemolysin secretion/activation protein [Opitutaceae bacterium]|nr:ShlB/FhaC/HecB family hemolysin secretion/activation protein [Opitutaceae bacterium]
MHPRFLRPLAALAVSAAALGAPLRSAAPDAGQVLRDQPQITGDRRPEPATAPEPAAAPSAVATGSVVVEVKAFRFTGYAELAAEAELQAAVASWVGRSVAAAELQGVATAVTTLLRRKGFLLARAFFPPQDITAGTIELGVVQAKVDGPIGIRRSGGGRMAEERLRALATDSIAPGQPLRNQDLERALLLINDLPGVVGRVLLEQGAAPGTTRVSLDVSEGNLVAGSVWADNFGSRYTGALRGNGILFLNDPTGRGDQLALLLSAASAMRQGRAIYSAPLGASGLKGNLAGSLLAYDIGKEFADLDLQGGAFTLNGWFTYPLVLRRDCGVTASLGYEYKALADQAAGIDTRDRRLASGSLGLNGFGRDTLGGGGYSAWSVAVTAGDIGLSRVPSDQAQDLAGPRAGGSFARLNLSLSRIQQLPGGFSFLAAYFGQCASGNLNSSEKFALGGPYGLRAYPVGEASGDEGHLLNFELRRELRLGRQGGALQLVGFFDAGTIRLNKDRWTGDLSSATRKNSYRLSGAGAGLNYDWHNRLSLRLSYAWRLGANPGRSTDGRNADGRDAPGCFWVSGQIRL